MLKKIMRFISAGVLIGASQMLPVCASGDQCTAVIPIEADTTTDSSVTVTSTDKNAMDSVLESVVSFNGSSKAEAVVTADEPAEYEYTLAQVPGTTKNVKYDDSTYKAKVFFESRDDGDLESHVVVWKTGSDSKSETVHFYNTSDTPKEDSHSGTEGKDIVPYVCAVIAGSAIIACSVHQHKKRDEENEAV